MDAPKETNQFIVYEILGAMMNLSASKGPVSIPMEIAPKPLIILVLGQ
jgi:hypothetical protein